MIRKRKFNSVFGAGLEKMRDVEKLKCDEFAVIVDRVGFHHGAVYGPDRSGNEKRIDRIASDYFYRRVYGTG